LKALICPHDLFLATSTGYLRESAGHSRLKFFCKKHPNVTKVKEALR
jgi:hypothetical protein